MQLAPPHFDAATFEIWGALLNGGRLVLAPDGVPDPAVLESLIQAEKVDTLWLTAGLFNTLVEHRPELFRGLHQLVTGGDVLSVRHVRLALGLLPKDARLVNGYGPTEGTTFTCCYTIPRDFPDTHSIPIGWPIANTRVAVLDCNQQLVPIGVPGELYIGGDGVALGYLNQPEWTSERFSSSRVGAGFAESTSSRRQEVGSAKPAPTLQEEEAAAEIFYRTGDLVRWRADGNLEFLGRLDQQVKIRGFRIEPGEIQAVLERHPAVGECVVIIRESATGKQLVAYHTPATAALSVREGELKEYLSGLLPDYMVPAAFVPLGTLPLTANGKVDRRALPNTNMPAEEKKSYHAPANETETIIASIWSDLLHIERVDIRDSNWRYCLFIH